MYWIWLVNMILSTVILFLVVVVGIKSFFTKPRTLYLVMCLLLAVGVSSTLVVVNL